jgi:catechol 2,3-dioxygenase-like lactoylglutathione lyase family enzyme
VFAASKTIGCMTLFVEDLQLARSFYSDVFGKPLVFEDPRCAIFDFGSTLINLLAAPAAVGLIAPAPVGGRTPPPAFNSPCGWTMSTRPARS